MRRSPIFFDHLSLAPPTLRAAMRDTTAPRPNSRRASFHPRCARKGVSPCIRANNGLTSDQVLKEFDAMPRFVRHEHAGAVYHVMCRGDCREAIFFEDGDRELFLATLAAICARTKGGKGSEGSGERSGERGQKKREEAGKGIRRIFLRSRHWNSHGCASAGSAVTTKSRIASDGPCPLTEFCPGTTCCPCKRSLTLKPETALRV